MLQGIKESNYKKVIFRENLFQKKNTTESLKKYKKQEFL